MNQIIVALDGYSGTGKSSTAKKVAAQLGYTYIDSGAMYRAVTYHFIQGEINIESLDEVKSALQNCTLNFSADNIYLNGVNVEEKIRTMEVNAMVSKVSAISMVRSKLVEEQRKMGEKKGVVMDGRDIGTVVFPNAELKIFMTASIAVRTERRRKELESKGFVESSEDIAKNLIDRDEKDSSRKDSPLIKTSDAIEIDTSHLTLNDQVEKIVSMAEKIIYES